MGFILMTSCQAFAIPLDNFDLRKEFQTIYQDLLTQSTGSSSWTFADWEAGFLTRESVGMMKRFRSAQYYFGLGPAFNSELRPGLISAIGLDYPMALRWNLNGELSSTRDPASLWENEASVSAVYLF